MAYDDWDVTLPLDHLKIGNVPGAIRDIQSAAKIIISKEHVTPSTDNAGGQHAKGSSRVFLDSAAPAVDPEGNSLDTSATSDDGRLCVLTGASNALQVYVATTAGISTGFQNVAARRVYLADTMNANSKPIVGLPSATQSGSPIHVGQLDTGYFDGITTGVLQLKAIATFLAASGQDGVTVMASRQSKTLEANDTEIYSDAPGADTWASVDASAQVGEQAALLFLEVSVSTATYVAVKSKSTDGSSSVDDHANSGANLGCSQSYFNNSSKIAYLLVMTDTDGTFQLGCTNTATITLTIRGALFPWQAA